MLYVYFVQDDDGRTSEWMADQFAVLQAENGRLTALLEAHGIEWRQPSPSYTQRVRPSPRGFPPPTRRLFRGRKVSGKSGYAPACANDDRAVSRGQLECTLPAAPQEIADADAGAP